MRKYNILVGCAAISLGLMVFYLGRHLAGFDEHGVPGENYWPYIIAGLLTLLGTLQIGDALFFSAHRADTPVDLSSRPIRMAYLSALISLLYGVLLLCIGFFASTMAFIPLMMRIMGERKPWVLALSALSVAGVIYVFFTLVFNTTLPESILWE